MELRYHPLFARWLEQLADDDEDVFGEVMALLTALEQYGRALEDEVREESHPIVTASYDLHALRRTPPTTTTPYATDPPVLRVVYGYCDRKNGSELAVALFGGDKTTLGSAWYPRAINEAEARLEQYCRTYLELTPLKNREPR